MADKTISTAVITSVGAALREAVSNATNAGTALQTFVTAASKAKLPKTLENDTVNAIADAYAGDRWKDNPKILKSRKSEARALIRQHAYLSELTTALRASAHGACSYHDAVKVCRLMKELGSVGAAVEAFNTKTPSTPIDPVAKFTSAVQSFYQHVSTMKDKKKSAKLAALRTMCDALGIEAVKGAAEGESA
jgi:hypothetical protein